jgi:hypothetical protein
VKLLRAARVGTDGAALLDFFRRRTLSAADYRRIEILVRRLGSDHFAQREEASADLVRYGAAAIGSLRRARTDPDAEVARRARYCLEQIGSGPGPALPMAAARCLARRPPAGTVGVLLAYLPGADDPGVEEEVRKALLAASPSDSPADPALMQALSDPRPVMREAAAHVLGRKGDPAERAAVGRLLKDRDPGVRFRAAEALVVAGERPAVPALVDLLGEAIPAELAWQVEEVLCRLAGDQAPGVSAGDRSAEGRRKCREAWAGWWAKSGATLDLAGRAEAGRLLGLTLGIEYNTGRVWERGRDGTPRWEITNLAGPMEAQVLPGGRVLIVESNNNTLSERDFKGKVLWSKKLDRSPTGCRRLSNGHTFVSTYNRAMEFDREGRPVYSCDLRGSNAICKHQNGHILYTVDTGEIVEADTAGKKVRSIPLPRQGMYVGIQDLPGDRFLVANSTSGRVLEVDAKGKVLWQANVPSACGVCRLPNGHTLVAAAGRVVELDRAGKKAWETITPGYVRRVHRR